MAQHAGQADTLDATKKTFCTDFGNLLFAFRAEIIRHVIGAKSLGEIPARIIADLWIVRSDFFIMLMVNGVLAIQIWLFRLSSSEGVVIISPFTQLPPSLTRTHALQQAGFAVRNRLFLISALRDEAIVRESGGIFVNARFHTTCAFQTDFTITNNFFITALPIKRTSEIRFKAWPLRIIADLCTSISSPNHKVFGARPLVNQQGLHGNAQLRKDGNNRMQAEKA